jgi:uncharacterized membrane protein YfcA
MTGTASAGASSRSAVVVTTRTASRLFASFLATFYHHQHHTMDLAIFLKVTTGGMSGNVSGCGGNDRAALGSGIVVHFDFSPVDKSAHLLLSNFRK